MNTTPTIKDVARACGVSTATVSRALNNSGYVSEELKQKILEACDSMGYIQNVTARSLKLKATGLIGYVTSDISNQYHIAVAKAIERVLLPSNYNVILCSTEGDPQLERRHIQLLLGRNVDALVINTTGGNNEFISDLSRRIPVVLVNRKLPEDLPFRGDFTDSNNVLGTYLLTKQLLDKGHRRICFLSGPATLSNARERFDGFKKAMAEYGISVDENYPYLYSDSFVERTGYDGVRAVFSREGLRPTAIVSSNNTMTIGALTALYELGVSVPEEVSINGFNGLENLELMRTRPTVANFAPDKIGEAAGHFTLSRIASPDLPNREFILDPEMISGNAEREI